MRETSKIRPKTSTLRTVTVGFMSRRRRVGCESRPKMSKTHYSHITDDDNPYNPPSPLQSAFNVDIDENYTKTVRFGVNVELGHIGNQRAISTVFVENGASAESVVKLSWCDFLVTFWTFEPYCVKIHGRDIVQSGIIPASEIDAIMSSVETRRYGLHNYQLATCYNGIPTQIKIVRLARGKRLEHTDGTPRTHVPKTYKRNRRSNW